MEGDSANKLDVEMDHLPGHGLAVHHNILTTQAAGGILHHGISFGENFVEIFGARSFECGLDSMARS